jgi:hypothetical protein
MGYARRTAGLASFCTGSAGLTAANSMGSAAGRRIGRGSGKAASALLVSAISTERAASSASFCTGSGVFADAIRTGGVAGGSGLGSGKAAPPLHILATETPFSPSAAGCGASTCSARAVTDATRLSSIGAPVFPIPGQPRPASPAAPQPVRTTVPAQRRQYGAAAKSWRSGGELLEGKVCNVNGMRRATFWQS